MASRCPPQMKQKAAINAGVYSVLPITVGEKTYSLETLTIGELQAQAHEVVCKTKGGAEIWRTRIYENTFNTDVETDVQEVYAVDLYVKDNIVGVELEYRDPIFVDAATGKLLK